MWVLSLSCIAAMLLVCVPAVILMVNLNTRVNTIADATSSLVYNGTDSPEGIAGAMHTAGGILDESRIVMRHLSGITRRPRLTIALDTDVS